MLSARVHLSTVCLAMIAMIDLVATLVLLRLGMREANPIFGPILHYGIVPFAVAKLVFVAAPILAIEWARTKRPATAEAGTWIAAAAYLFLLGRHMLALV